ncbi:ras gtpase-activating protein [Anaeramoeba flamelloides]|uniref:Ras gtpase-activating protein n=1 Tax=Anaeramoeba flamelloides TaxID=1746091 RepID=A0ABQ8XIY0_9EUKA|nr:ras gtpase-activating protein [Anaeramoeba flamelloides]
MLDYLKLDFVYLGDQNNLIKNWEKKHYLWITLNNKEGMILKPNVYFLNSDNYSNQNIQFPFHLLNKNENKQQNTLLLQENEHNQISKENSNINQSTNKSTNKKKKQDNKNENENIYHYISPEFRKLPDFKDGWLFCFKSLRIKSKWEKKYIVLTRKSIHFYRSIEEFEEIRFQNNNKYNDDDDDINNNNYNNNNINTNTNTNTTITNDNNKSNVNMNDEKINKFNISSITKILYLTNPKDIPSYSLLKKNYQTHVFQIYFDTKTCLIFATKSTESLIEWMNSFTILKTILSIEKPPQMLSYNKNYRLDKFQEINIFIEKNAKKIKKQIKEIEKHFTVNHKRFNNLEKIVKTNKQLKYLTLQKNIYNDWNLLILKRILRLQIDQDFDFESRAFILKKMKNNNVELNKGQFFKLYRNNLQKNNKQPQFPLELNEEYELEEEELTSEFEPESEPEFEPDSKFNQSLNLNSNLESNLESNEEPSRIPIANTNSKSELELELEDFKDLILQDLNLEIDIDINSIEKNLVINNDFNQEKRIEIHNDNDNKRKNKKEIILNNNDLLIIKDKRLIKIQKKNIRLIVPALPEKFIEEMNTNTVPTTKLTFQEEINKFSFKKSQRILFDGLLMENNFKLIKTILDVSPVIEYDKILAEFTCIWERKNISIQILEYLIQQEIESQKVITELFRSNSTPNKVIGHFTKLIGIDYLQGILNETILEIVNHEKSFEITERKLQLQNLSGDLLENQKRLSDYTTKTLDIILDSFYQIPLKIREISNIIWKHTQAKFPEAKYVVIAGFFFLKFVSPLLSMADKSGLIVGIQIKPQARRSLILISKAIQNIANGVPFKEKDMSFLNHLVFDYHHKIQQFMDSLIEPIFLSKNYENKEIILLKENSLNNSYFSCWGNTLNNQIVEIFKDNLNLSIKSKLRFSAQKEISENDYFLALKTVVVFLRVFNVHHELFEKLDYDEEFFSKIQYIFTLY